MNECEARQPKNNHLSCSPFPRKKKKKKTTVLLGWSTNDEIGSVGPGFVQMPCVIFSPASPVLRLSRIRSSCPGLPSLWSVGGVASPATWPGSGAHPPPPCVLLFRMITIWRGRRRLFPLSRLFLMLLLLYMFDLLRQLFLMLLLLRCLVLLILLGFYHSIKTNYNPSAYLDSTRKNPMRRTLVKLRIGCHSLRVEAVRYKTKSPLSMKGYVPSVVKWL